MTSQFFSSAYQFETNIIAEVNKAIGRKATSLDIFHNIITLLKKAIDEGAPLPHMQAYARLAIKLSPYATQVTTLATIHNQAVLADAQRRMPGLIEIVKSCRDQGLAVPLIISCEKYMPAALKLQQTFREHYFSIPPIIVRGSTSINEPVYEAPVLTLPVGDSYEALPVKIFEAYTFFQAIDRQGSIIKIDDDLKPVTGFTPDRSNLVALFSHADYMGIPVQNIFHDRLWHDGKCGKAVPPVYAKPIKSSWARGALYVLSHTALEKLALYYMRFPGCLDGERYEDKAVGDVLHENSIHLTGYHLEPLLGLDSREQERS